MDEDSLNSSRESFHEEIASRFGILPNFFCTAPAADGLIEELWAFAKSAYLDSPLPSLFKERLFVHLSRFCEVRYCIVRHVGFLVGEGRPAGDAEAEPLTVAQVARLLRRPLPDAATLDHAFGAMEASIASFELPEPETANEARLFDALTIMFVAPTRSARARDAVRTCVGDRHFELLVAFLAFVRTAHYWTETHPDLDFEPDIVAWMERHPELAALLLSTREAVEASPSGQLRKVLGDLDRTEDALRETENALRRSDIWLAAQKDAFQAAMNDAALEKSLGVLVRAVTEQADGAPKCAFYINDGNGGLRHVVGMSDIFARQIDGFEISPGSLACGLAVATGNAVITPDVLEEPRWQAWKWLANEHSFRGCWSFPVETAAGTLVGSFALYFSEPRRPTQSDLDLASALTRTAAILISRHQESVERARVESALRERETTLRLLLAELQHRVRNILATVRAIANRTGWTQDSLENFRAHFDGRLAALARTQNALTRSPGTGIDLENLIREELLAQTASDKQFSLAGPAIKLSPKAAEVLTLAVHELATNSTKYGALAQVRGRIKIEWCRAEHDGSHWLSFGWTESGVNMPKKKPARRGFGTELITRRIPHELDGEGSIGFGKSGVRAEISFPLRDGQSTLETGFPRPVEEHAP